MGHMQIASDDSLWTSARAVDVVQLISTADSRTERLRVLLTVSNSRHCITPMCPIQPSLMSAVFPKKSTPPLNSCHTKMCSEKNSRRGI